MNRSRPGAIAKITAVLAWAAVAAAPAAQAAPTLAGFVEGAQTMRIDDNAAFGDGDAGDRTYPRSELRAQLTARDGIDEASFFLRVDLLSDATGAERSQIDLREAYIKFHPASWLDVKFGRQVATWGTGDMIFANDFFAKDWEAFFTGLDDSYLKPPQDLLRMSFYVGGVTAELAASPHFTPDNLPDGRRLSVYNPFLRQAVGIDQAPPSLLPERNLSHGELFARTAGYRHGIEWALYGYRGFWPTPQGVQIVGDMPHLSYPRLWSTGASLRGPLGSLLVSAEGALYLSPDDSDGDDPMLPNSQVRGFVGVEKSLGSDWTVGAQYYGEQMLDYAAYVEGFGGQEPLFEELRSTATGRITKFMLNQNLHLSLFGYWGTADGDWHLRPAISYKLDDAVTGTVGANFMDGDQAHTMFGQFRDNSNIYLRLRYSF